MAYSVALKVVLLAIKMHFVTVVEKNEITINIVSIHDTCKPTYNKSMAHSTKHNTKHISNSDK